MFKSVEESLELYKQGVESDTGFEYVYNAEEVDFGDEEYAFSLDRDTDAQLEEIKNNSEIDIVQIGRQPFSEFTFPICPAYKA